MGHHCDMRRLHRRCRMAVVDGKKQTMNNPPCKGCERRTARPNCHTNCQEYKNFVMERQKYHEERRKQSLIAEYIKSRHERLDKYENRR